MIGLRTVLAASAAILIGTATLGSTQASAAVINGSDFTDGLTAQTIGGIDFVGSPRAFRKKTVDGFTGVGIKGGITSDEIDVGEFLTGTDGAFSVTSFRIGVLFDGPEFSDVNETARVTVTHGGGTTVGDLTVTGETTATWSLGGAVTNLSAATGNKGGVWEVSNPFAGIFDITKIEFTAVAGICDTPGGCKSQSDFTMVQLVTENVAVAEPASLALLGMGLMGLGLARRRRA